MNSKHVLIRPVFTEKTMGASSERSYTFEVHPKSNKKEIAQAIKDYFSVDADTVRTHIRPGKTKRLMRSRKTTRTAARKFAVVSLPEGQKLSGFDTVLEVDENAD